MRIIIFANGIIRNPSQEAELWIHPNDIVVAANGGTKHAMMAGLTPAHIIGDLDSLTPNLRTHLEHTGTVFHSHPPAKDETDLELALLWAVAALKAKSEKSGYEMQDARCRTQSSPIANDKRNASALSAIQHPASGITVLGALGGRPDQELANLLLLALPALQGTDVVIADGTWSIRCIREGKNHYLHGRVGDTLSLIPLGGTVEGVVTQGLAYPLRDETLHFGPARGVSNVFEEEFAAVSVRKGMLWCFHKSQKSVPDV